MTLDAVYEIIKQAKEAELKSHNCGKWLTAQLETLHHVISLQGLQPADDLYNFVAAYIDLAPKVIDCVSECAEKSKKRLLFQPFVELALGYFVHPSVIVLQHTGMDGLLIRAYQCHRLIEELYENNKSLRNSAVCNMQTTQANLLAHHLIGEPFANEVDNAAHASFRQLVSMPDYYDLNLASYLAKTNEDRWMELNESWLNLLDKHHITINFMIGHRY